MDDRHTRAVLAYCREFCGADEAEDVARQVVAAMRSDHGDAPELLQITQRVAASHAELDELQGEWRRMLESVREARATRAFMATLEAGPEALALVPPLAEEPVPPPEEELVPPPEATAAELESPEQPLAEFEEPVTQQYEAVVTPPPTEPEPPPEEPELPAETAEPPPDLPPRRGLVVFPAASAPSESEAAAPAPTFPAPPRSPRTRPRSPRTRPRSSGRSAGTRPQPPPPGLAPASVGLLREYRVFWATLLAGAVVVAIVGLLVGGSSGSQAISLPPPSLAVGQATQTIPAPTTPARHRVHRVHRRARTHKDAARATAQSSAAGAPTTTQAPVSPPTTQSPANTSNGVVATQQNSSLPAQTAPTQTVGAGSTTTSTT